MEKLFKTHYQATVNRGLITDRTCITEFIEKINEEFNELKELHDNFEANTIEFDAEAMDLICATMNMLIHYGVDIEKELLKNIETQEKRANKNN